MIVRAFVVGAHVNTVDSSYQAGFDAMKEKLEEVSGGKMTVEIHPNGELGGNEAELVEKMATGTVDMIVASPNFVATTGVKEADLFSIPFLYTGLDHCTARYKPVLLGLLPVRTIRNVLHQSPGHGSLRS